LAAVYGIVDWNKDGEDESIVKKEMRWDKDEHKSEETL